jgi:nitroreductase
MKLSTLLKNILQQPLLEKPRKIYFLGVKNQAYLALGNLLTVCANEKIDSCPMEGFIPEKYDEVLGLKEKNLSSVLVLPVGYRAEDDIMTHQKKVRKNVDEIVIDIS